MAPSTTAASGTGTAPAGISGSEWFVKKQDGKVVVIQRSAAGGSKTTSLPTSTTPAWQGTAEPTVDATKHVNGGCRAQNQAGTEGVLHRSGRGAAADHRRELPRSVRTGARRRLIGR